MNAVDTLKQTELTIAGLSPRDKKRLFKKLSQDADLGFQGIEHHKHVMGGVACIRKTRIPVWLLHQARLFGLSEGDILKSYPGLTAEDLVNAWNYVAAHADEIESQIKANERDD